MKDRCVNGCDAPVCPPSKVLCKKCLKALDRKMKRLLSPPRQGEAEEK